MKQHQSPIIALLFPDYSSVDAGPGRQWSSTLWSARRRTHNTFGLESHASTLVARLYVYRSLGLYTCLVAYHMNARSPTSVCMPFNDQTYSRIQTRAECNERNLGDPTLAEPTFLIESAEASWSPVNIYIRSQGILCSLAQQNVLNEFGGRPKNQPPPIVALLPPWPHRSGC